MQKYGYPEVWLRVFCHILACVTFILTKAFPCLKSASVSKEERTRVCSNKMIYLYVQNNIIRVFLSTTELHENQNHINPRFMNDITCYVLENWMFLYV